MHGSRNLGIAVDMIVEDLVDSLKEECDAKLIRIGPKI
jgi:hypothetical protein